MVAKVFLGAMALAVSMANAAIAAPVNVNFFAGPVSGTFYGLDDTDGRSSAVTFDLFSGVDSYTNVEATGALFNIFEFSNGSLTLVDFFYDTQFPLGDNGLARLAILDIILNPAQPNPGDIIPVYERTLAGSLEETIGTSPRFDVVPAGPGVAPVPLPAASGLLVAGLACLFGLNRRRLKGAMQ